VAIERLNPHPRMRRECGAPKIKGIGFVSVEASATRLTLCFSLSAVRSDPLG
jgi:hypothetical protein